MPQIQGQAQASTPNNLRPVHVIPPQCVASSVEIMAPAIRLDFFQAGACRVRSSFATPAVMSMPRCHTCSMQCRELTNLLSSGRCSCATDNHSILHRLWPGCEMP